MRGKKLSDGLIGGITTAIKKTTKSKAKGYIGGHGGGGGASGDNEDIIEINDDDNNLDEATDVDDDEEYLQNFPTRTEWINSTKPQYLKLLQKYHFVGKIKSPKINKAHLVMRAHMKRLEEYRVTKFEVKYSLKIHCIFIIYTSLNIY